MERKKKNPRTQNDVYVNNKKPKTSGMNYALFLLSRRDYSSLELKKKLFSKVGGEEADEVVADLVRRGLISDERYLIEIIEKYAFTKRYGFLKVESELVKRGIKRDVYYKTLCEMYTDDKERENAMYFLNKKSSDKIRLYLLSRGFRSHTVQEILYRQ